MFLFFMIIGLVLLIAGGAGLFYTNSNILAGAPLWVIGNLAFGTFVFLGIGLLIFLALFNTEFD